MWTLPARISPPLCSRLIIGSEEQVATGETAATRESVRFHRATQSSRDRKQEAGSRSGDSASSFLHHLPLNLERMFASSLFILFISASLLLPADRSALLSMHRAAITHEYNILPFLKDPPPLRNMASRFNRTLQHKSFLMKQ